jgi:hypothetical protein
MAGELILILQDFFATGADGTVAAAEPRLPALETLLATARHRQLGQDWRTELAARFGHRLPLEASPARVVASACLRGACPDGCWLVTPVHYFAGLDSVHLHPAGLLELTPEMQQVLARDFNRVFADATWRLSVAGGRELLLTGASPAAGGHDPARSLGARLESGPAYGTGAADMRRLSVEVEMWLHAHVLNRQREARGELPVSGLWAWGAEPMAGLPRNRAAAPGAKQPVLRGTDTFAQALWRLRGGEAAALTGGFGSGGISTAHSDQVVLYPTVARGQGDSALRDFERAWLAPALAALRSGELAAIELLAGAHSFRLRRLGLARFWRPRAHWREALA